MCTIWKKVRTCRATFTSRYEFDVGAVEIHRVDLIALEAIPLRLKDKFLSVKGEIRFSILTAKCQLANIAQMLLAW